MTNFQGTRSAGSLRWITPERALQTIPAVLGAAVAVLMIAFAARPIWESTRVRQEDVNTLLIKANALPVVRQDLANQLRERELLREQESRLLQLLAGTQDLGTFLAELNALAKRNQVTILSAEPGEVEKFVAPVEQTPDGMESPASSAPQSPASDTTQGDPSTADPLLKEGFEKRSADLSVQGLFPNVVAFLQDLESLQVFVITSDLNLSAASGASQSRDGEGKGKKLLETKLDLKLTVYGLSQAFQPRGDLSTSGDPARQP